jgi:tRNA (uracil-5-)-methyltransferase
MECSHFGACGSCTLFSIPYEEQKRQKLAHVRQLLAPFYHREMKLIEGATSHYRARAEFRIWHEGSRCDYTMSGFAKEGSKQRDRVVLVECPKVIEPIAKRMWRLLEEINASSEILKKRLFGVEFLATTTDEVLITMIYHRKLDSVWEMEARGLEERLSCKIIGRSRKQKVVISEAFVLERLIIEGKPFFYRHYEGGFTQPNPLVNSQMIAWAIMQAKKVGRGDLLEAYCGLGNFTIPLSHHFDKVLATEISKRSIASAKENCGLNGVENIAFIRLSSEEMSEALESKRTFERLKEVDLVSYHFSMVLVDPPRAGLDEATTKLIATIDHILYISCNPTTLARDLEPLCRTHRVEEGVIFDQFPHTSHIESGVFLTRK